MVLAGIARTSAFVLSALILGGCASHLAAVIMPDTEPGSDYYDGYMAGVSFAEDAWNHIGTAAVWLDGQSLRATDVAIQKALVRLPPSIVGNHSQVWIDAFRAGASGRFDQYRVFAGRERATTCLGQCAVGFVGMIVVLSLILLQQQVPWH